MNTQSQADAATINSVRGNKKLKTRNMVIIAMFGAVSMVLMMIEVPLPFAPSFLKFDLSDLPSVLATFMMGPLGGILVSAVKIILKLLIKGTTTAFVGEFANFLAAVFYMVPAAIIYKFKKGRSGAIIALLTGTVIVSIACCISNMYILFPAYSELYKLPMEGIIGMGTAINPMIKDLFTMMLFAVLPFNLFKYSVVSVITFFLYKRLKHVLFKGEK